ncbi:hypothetical protein FD41_GL000237 [Lentilactobacillus farraginis DSM 18382 = JCM 14108]|uniref:Uncharacterized protein n=2 Tax=Lentilactobacillus farraginis DSM 18382 = JCM 14108 TaxID=1423743 RepID=A0A0R1VX47_9LACO|nr:hypothetical protein FD41_GL000237 [Lentilactobacillus farraginis DSM 18382 = JCM 14108]
MGTIAMNNHTHHFIGYDYLDISTNSKYKNIYLDALPNFGWLFIDIEKVAHKRNVVILHYKRNREMMNKSELTRLFHQFEATIKEIDYLEKKKNFIPTFSAILIGLTGCALMAGSVFTLEAQIIGVSVILGILGFAGWIISYFSYVKLFQKYTHKMRPEIEEKYDLLNRIAKKSSRLILTQ